MTPYSYHDPLLILEHVSLELGGRPILRDINAEILDIKRPGLQQGQVVSILGPSGIGKSQLLYLIAGLREPTAGQVLVPYAPPDQFQKVKRGLVGVVFQNYPLFKHRTVYGNLTLARKQSGASLEKLAEVACRFKLDDERILKSFPAQLSGGQRQRVAIAQQVLCGDHLLLMDEPFSGLDIIMEAEVIKLIIELSTADELNTIVLVTHDVSAAVAVSDHLWLLGHERDLSDPSIHTNDGGQVHRGAKVPGARIVETFDLIERDLCWHPDLSQSKECTEFVREVKSRFTRL